MAAPTTIYPIWRDRIVNLGSTDGIDYRIKLNGAVIYAGKAFLRPGSSANEIKINSICADYLSQENTPITDDWTTEAAPIYKTFVLEKYSGGTWASVNSYPFILDYSYKSRTGLHNVSAPINGRCDKKQLLFFTEWIDDNLDVVVTLPNGTTETGTFTVATAGFYNCEINLYYYPVGTTITVGTRVYKIVSECGSYALTYVNAFGGWDSLLIEGNHQAAADVERMAFKKAYDTSVETDSNECNYLNSLTDKLTLHTGIMTDAESIKMSHLLGSTKILIQDLTSGNIYPVKITDNSFIKQTFRQNGNQVCKYDINVQITRDHFRR